MWPQDISWDLRNYLNLTDLESIGISWNQLILTFFFFLIYKEVNIYVIGYVWVLFNWVGNLGFGRFNHPTQILITLWLVWKLKKRGGVE